MFYVYLLKSKRNNEVYTGSTNDLKLRFKEHNTGKEKSTKRYLPWELVYYEAYNKESLARMREKKLKYHGNAIKELKKRVGLFSAIVSNKKKGEALPSTTFSSRKSGAGFTLLETLLVLAILAIIAGFIMPIAGSIFSQHNLNVSADRIESDLNRLYTFAHDGKNNSSWGMHIENNVVTTFAGNSYDANNTNGLNESYSISPTITIGGTLLNASMIDVVFAKGSGIPIIPHATDTITLTSDQGFVRKISINEKGRISIESIFPACSGDSSTKLLLHMNGDDGDSIFTDDSKSHHIISVNGNVVTKTSQKKMGSASGYFDGSSYLSVPESDDFNFGTGDFTIDTWVNIDSSNQPVYFTGMNHGSFFLAYDPSWNGGALGIGQNYVSWDYSVPLNLSNNVWHHIAVSRSNGIVYLFSDGVMIGSTTDTQNYNMGGGGLTIGYENNAYYFKGYLDEFRISKDVARWTHNFIPPNGECSLGNDPSFTLTYNSAGNGYISGNLNQTVKYGKDGTSVEAIPNGGYKFVNWSDGSTSNPRTDTSIVGNISVTVNFALVNNSYTKLLLHMNSDFSDSSYSNHQITVNGPSISNNHYKFGGASGYFNGSSYLTSPTSDDFSFSTENFTIDEWIYPTQTPNQYQLFYDGRNYAGANGMFLSLDNNSYLNAVWNNGANSIQSTSPVALNQWSHVALVRHNNEIKLYVNGTQSGNTISDSTNFTDNNLVIGQTVEGGNYYYGYLDELRVSKGLARWTSDFTPPSEEYVPGVGLIFDGSTYVSVPSNSNLNFGTGDFTISTWFKTNYSGYQALLSHGADYSPGYAIVFDGNGTIRFSIQDPNQNGADTIGTFNYLDNIWHHLVVNRSSSGTMNMYVDGSLINSVNNTIMNNDNNTDLLIGANQGGGSPFNGEISQVAIWNRTLNSSEISSLYNEGIGIYGDANVAPFYDSLAAGYNLDEGTGSTAHDFSENANSGYINGNTTWSGGLEFEKLPPTPAYSVQGDDTGGVITYTDSNGLNPRRSPAYAGGYTVHTFKNSGTYVANSNHNVEVLVVAGGGGGGSNYAPGGGAGGLIYNNSFAVNSGNISVGVGDGGTGDYSGNGGGNGGDSSFSTITATGGGGGGSNTESKSGGSGAGGRNGGAPDTSGAAGISGQGYAGGNGYYGGGNDYASGGGGGSGGVGGNGGSNSGDGGPGTTISISGNSVCYAGGGGGGAYLYYGVNGGNATCGGGTGGTYGNGTNAIVNTGGGGGGGSGGWQTVGGSGGSGIVIIRYPTPQ